MNLSLHQRTFQRITRRQALAVAGSGVISSCTHPGVAVPKSRVSILRAPAYTQKLYEDIRGVIVEHGINVRGKYVVLKPNLVEFDERTTVNTNPLLVHAALEAFRSLGAARVQIAEGPGHRRITMDLAEAAGYCDVISDFGNVFTDLNLDEVSRVEFSRPLSKLGSVYLPNTIRSCDLLVSMPKMKTHHWVGATLSMKNLFGIVPGAVYGWPKNVLHWAGINECIVDLHRSVPRQFAIVDGIEGMEGNGPIQGTPKHAGVIVAGTDPVAVDATCCRIMQIDPHKIAYLAMAQDRGQTIASNVVQIGETVARVQTPFELIPEFRFLRNGDS